MASTAESYAVSPEGITQARDRIRSYGVMETPVFTSSIMDDLAGHDCFFKLELFQKTGSFKVDQPLIPSHPPIHILTYSLIHPCLPPIPSDPPQKEKNSNTRAES